MGSRVNSAVQKSAGAVPNYPGRQSAERLTQALLGELLKKYAGHQVQRLLGFWVMVGIYGGFHALVDANIIARGGAYRQRGEFRDLFGCDVEEWHPEMLSEFPELNGRLRLPGVEHA